MKKIIIPVILALFIGVTVSFFACNKNNITSKTLSSTTNSSKISMDVFTLTPNTFDFIGETHNNGLDYVFDNTINGNSNVNYEEISNSTIHYISQVNEFTKLSSDNLSVLSSNESKTFFKSICDQHSISSTFIKKYISLTFRQSQFVDTLGVIVADTNLTSNEAISKIVNLELASISNLDSNEVVYALCLSNVAKHSIAYWSNAENASKWLNHFGSEPNANPIYSTYGGKAPTQTNINWHNVAVADVLGFGAGFPAGVTTGMVAGGLAAGVATGGVAAGIGAVLGGLVGGTATGLASATLASAGALAAEVVVGWFGF